MYGAGKKSANGQYQEVLFFKGKNLMIFSCRSDLATEILQSKLQTPFDIWFTMNAKEYKPDHYFQNAFICHFENATTKALQEKQAKEYAQGKKIQDSNTEID